MIPSHSPSAPLPKARTLGATLAAQAGVAVDDISSMITGQASNSLNSFIGFRSLPIVILLIVL